MERERYPFNKSNACQNIKLNIPCTPTKTMKNKGYKIPRKMGELTPKNEG